MGWEAGSRLYQSSRFVSSSPVHSITLLFSEVGAMDLGERENRGKD